MDTVEQTQTFVEVLSSAIQPVNIAAEHKIAAIIISGNNLTLEMNITVRQEMEFHPCYSVKYW